MGLALLFIVLPFGIVAGIVFGALPKKLRIPLYIIQVLAIIIGFVILESSKLYGSEFFTGFFLGAGAVISLGTMLGIVILRVLVPKVFAYLKRVEWRNLKYKYIVSVVAVVLIAIPLWPVVQHHYKTTKLIGKWYGRYDISNLEIQQHYAMTYLEVLDNGVAMVSTATHPEKQVIELNLDNVKFPAKNVLRVWIDFPDGSYQYLSMTRSIENEAKYFDAEISNTSKYDLKETALSEEELSLFWKRNIQPIIDLDQSKIHSRISYPILLHKNYDFSKYIYNDTALSYLEERNGSNDYMKFYRHGLPVDTLKELNEFFSDEMRMGLTNFDQKDIRQVDYGDDGVLLVVFFLGKQLNMRNNAFSYRNFGLVFDKTDSGWLFLYHNFFDEIKYASSSEKLTSAEWLEILPNNIPRTRDNFIDNSIKWKEEKLLLSKY